MRDPCKCRFFLPEGFKKLPFGIERGPSSTQQSHESDINQAKRAIVWVWVWIRLTATSFEIRTPCSLETKANKKGTPQVTPPLTSPVRWLWLAGSLRATEVVNDPLVVISSLYPGRAETGATATTINGILQFKRG